MDNSQKDQQSNPQMQLQHNEHNQYDYQNAQQGHQQYQCNDYDYQNYCDQENQYNDYPQDYNDYYIEAQPLHQNYSNKQYEVLPSNALFPEVQKHLATARQMTALPQGWCLLLLRQFRWDIEKLTDYYSDTFKYKQKIHYDPNYKLPTDQIKSFIGSCEVCCNQNQSLYPNICNHAYCQECWKSHLKTSIQSGNPFLRCMGCQCPILLQTILSLLQKFFTYQRRLLDIYQKLVCQQFSTIHRNYQFCTGVDCGNCIKVYNLNLRSVKCTCGKVFCFKCKSDDHSPCTCQQKSKWMENVLKQEADAKWMSVNAKLCPWCKKAVQRSAGCNFMACVCGKNFCYLCSRPWQPDHKDHFKCHIYKKSSTQQVSRQKQILQKMNFYTERFLDNQATAVNNKRIDTFEQRKLLFKVLKIQLSDSQFIDTAFKFSIECCDCLKWIYAYSYYAKWRNSIDEESFKFDQGEFQKYKVNLLKMLAVDLKNFMNKVKRYSDENVRNKNTEDSFVSQFKQLKKAIVNYFTMTKKYKEKFIQEIQNKNQDISLGLNKKKSSQGIQRKESQKKQKKNPQHHQRKQKQDLQVPSKMITRSSAQRQKPVQNQKNSVTGFFGKYF